MVESLGFSSAVVAMSGGIDSAVCAYAANQQGIRTRLIHGWFGKKSSVMDMHCAKALALNLDLPIEIVDLIGIYKLQMGYLPIEQLESDEADINGWKSGSPTGFYVMASVASYYAQLNNIQNVIIGITKKQVENKKDFFQSLEKLSESINMMNPGIPPIQIHAPLINMEKDEIIKIAQGLNLPLEKTWSCYLGEKSPCGECSGCIERESGFSKIGIVDPLKKRT